MISKVLFVQKYIITEMMQIICSDNLNSKVCVCVCVCVCIGERTYLEREKKLFFGHSTRLLLKSEGTSVVTSPLSIDLCVWIYKVPGLRVESELQLLAYAPAAATPASLATEPRRELLVYKFIAMTLWLHVAILIYSKAKAKTSKAECVRG